LPCEPGETTYWSKVKEYANELIKRYWTFDIHKMLQCLSYEVYAHSDFRISDLRRFNSKKNDVMLRDDLMLTAKLLYEEERELRGTRIGVIPMAGRPVHAGHWCLIKNALSESDTVYLFVSVKGRGDDRERIEAGRMMKVWKDVLLPSLDKRVIVRFVENPVLDANRFVKDASRNHNKSFTFYGDEDDVSVRWNEKNIEALFSSLVKENRIFAKGFSREKTVNVSSTQMRKLIASRDIESLYKFLPDIPDEDRKTYLRILLNSQKR
jgi:nicotinamide mononucleotide adenylyltransferase